MVIPDFVGRSFQPAPVPVRHGTVYFVMPPDSGKVAVGLGLPEMNPVVLGDSRWKAVERVDAVCATGTFLAWLLVWISQHQR